jgi:hypothetical protein
MQRSQKRADTNASRVRQGNVARPAVAAGLVNRIIYLNYARSLYALQELRFLNVSPFLCLEVMFSSI